jgi:hypothetical protein
VEDAREGGSQPIGDARAPSSSPGDNHSEPPDGGNPAPKVVEGQRGDDVTIDDRNHDV